MDIEIPAPLPLPLPGQYAEEPALTWKVRSYQREAQDATVGKVFRVVNMPMPPDSRLIYHTYDFETVRELKEYAQTVLAGREAPEWMKKFDPYTNARLLAHSLNLSCLLQFDARFESGNLFSAYALSETEYKLYLAPDTNSKGHIQWFFFSVRAPKPMKATFHIVNFMKEKCLFAKGMKPCFSYESLGLFAHWQTISDACSYFPNGYSFSLKSGKTVEFHTLTFSFDFQRVNTPVYFAFALPYTLSDLNCLLAKLEMKDLQTKSVVFKRELLCESTLGLPIEVLTVTSALTKASLPSSRRKVIVLTARVHPGETPGSIVMHELISLLTSDEPEAKSLREQYIFKLVPMLNPDGVVIGNSRTGVEGVDLNRRWRGEDADCYPQLAAIKKLLKSLQSDGRIALFCDLHGHAKQTNAFLYGCSHVTDEGFTSWTKVRLLARVIARASQYFDYQMCKFKVQKSKTGTARVVAWQELGVANSYTLETSFYGYSHMSTVLPFTRTELFSFAHDVFLSLLTYHQVEGDLSKEIASSSWLKLGRKKEIAPAQPAESEERTVGGKYAGEGMEAEAVWKSSKLTSHSSESSESGKLQPSSSARSLGAEASSKKSIHPRKKRDLCPSWREFFPVEELALRSKLRREITEEESEFSGSDSAPSDGNLEESEIVALRNGAMEREIVHRPNPITVNSPRKTELRIVDDKRQAANGTGKIHTEESTELEVVSREFVRSREKFPPGKPQDFLFTKTGLAGLFSSPSESQLQRQSCVQVDSTPRRMGQRSVFKAKPQRATRISSHLITPPILLIEPRNPDKKLPANDLLTRRAEPKKIDRRHAYVTRDFAFPVLQIARSSKAATVASIIKSTERFSSLESSNR